MQEWIRRAWGESQFGLYVVFGFGRELRASERMRHPLKKSTNYFLNSSVRKLLHFHRRLDY